MTYDEICAIVHFLPCESAPPGFRWSRPRWESGPQYIAWRYLVSLKGDPRDGTMVGATVTLTFGELKLPKAERDQIARLRQELACASAVDLVIEKNLA